MGGRARVGRRMVHAVPVRGEVLAALRDREIVALDARTGAARPLLTLAATVQVMKVSQGGKWGAIHAYDGPVLLLDLRSGRHQELGNPSGKYSFAFRGDDQLFGLDDRGTIHHWDLARGDRRVLTQLPWGAAVGGIGTSGDGSRLLAKSIEQAALINLATGRSIPLDYGGAAAFASALSWDGSKAAISFGDGRVRLWERDGAGLRSRILTRRPGYAKVMLFTRDQRALFIADETGAVCRVDLPAGTVTEIGRHSAQIVNASLSPSERWLATSDQSGEIRIWEPASGAVAVLRGQGGERRVDFLTDDRLWSVAGDGWIDLLPFDRSLLVPPEPAALSRWLNRLTTAQITSTGGLASPF